MAMRAGMDGMVEAKRRGNKLFLDQGGFLVAVLRSCGVRNNGPLITLNA